MKLRIDQVCHHALIRRRHRRRQDRSRAGREQAAHGFFVGLLLPAVPHSQSQFQLLGEKDRAVRIGRVLAVGAGQETREGRDPKKSTARICVIKEIDDLAGLFVAQECARQPLEDRVLVRSDAKLLGEFLGRGVDVQAPRITGRAEGGERRIIGQAIVRVARAVIDLQAGDGTEFGPRRVVVDRSRVQRQAVIRWLKCWVRLIIGAVGRLVSLRIAKSDIRAFTGDVLSRRAQLYIEVIRGLDQQRDSTALRPSPSLVVSPVDRILGIA